MQYNLYAYCLDDPVNNQDDSGHFPIVLLLGAIVATMVAAVAYMSYVNITQSSRETFSQNIQQAVAALETGYQDKFKNQYIYALKDENQNVQYIGRTINPTDRAKAHARNENRADLSFQTLYSDLSKAEARGMEQTLMMYYHTKNTQNAMNNQINGTSPQNANALNYIAAAMGVEDYFYNQISNQLLCWLEGNW